MEESPATNPGGDSHHAMIAAFSEITSTSKEEATAYLQFHDFDFDIAVSTFFDTAAEDALVSALPAGNPTDTHSPSFFSRPASSLPSPGSQQLAGGNPNNPHSSNTDEDTKPSSSGSDGRIPDLNQRGDGQGSDSDEPQVHYTGGEKSGMLVQNPTKKNDDQARQAGAKEGTSDQMPPSSSSRSFAGRGGETTSAPPPPPPQQSEPDVHSHTINFWNNGFSKDDGPLRSQDDPQNASFLESIRKKECPNELKPVNKKTLVEVTLVWKKEDYPVQKQRHTPSSEDITPAPSPAPAPNRAPSPSRGLNVDGGLPWTSVQVRLADGTRMVSRFNLHHTIRDIRSFIDASRSGGPRAYQLVTVGVPQRQLNDLNQTIEEAGLANSVVIQKL